MQIWLWLCWSTVQPIQQCCKHFHLAAMFKRTWHSSSHVIWHETVWDRRENEKMCPRSHWGSVQKFLSNEGLILYSYFIIWLLPLIFFQQCNIDGTTLPTTFFTILCPMIMSNEILEHPSNAMSSNVTDIFHQKHIFFPFELKII